jgi:4-amino-4-deoxy-L-arabinose transferase-like glycosyltransferase
MIDRHFGEKGSVSPMHDAPITATFWKNRILILGLLLLGTALRLCMFGQIPPGLYHDEAQHGLDALHVLDGNLKLFFEANNGREPLFVYAVTAAVAVLGRTPWAIRIPAVFAGVLTLAAVYDLGRLLVSRRMGRWALAVLTVTLWHVHLSRVGYRAVLLPLFNALFLAQAVRALRSHTRRHWATAGLWYGLSWYTYSAVRMTPLALAGIVLYGLIKDNTTLTRHGKGALIFCLVGLIVLMPLGIYTAMHPDIVLSRAGQVSVFSEEINQGRPWRTLGLHSLRTAGMFFIRGDRIWRHNLAYRPVWGPALGLAFILGGIIYLRRFRERPGAALVIIWTLVTAIPTVLAEDAPHFLRASGMLPVVALIPARGLSWLETKIAQLRDDGIARYGRQILPILLLLIGTVSTVHAYFVRYAKAELAYHWFEAGPVQVAGAINRLTQQGWDGKRMLHNPTAARTILIDQKLWESWTAIPFLVPKSNVQFVANTPQEPIDPGAGFIVWPYRDWKAEVMPRLPHPAYLYSPEGPLAQGDKDPEPYTIANIIVADPLPPLPPPVATFEGGITLHAALVQASDDEARVQLWWRATEALPGNYTIFVHYLRDDTKIAQHDSAPVQGDIPTPLWQPGDVVLDIHPMPDVNPKPAHDRLRIGLYDPATGVGLKRIDETGNILGDYVEISVILANE